MSSFSEINLGVANKKEVLRCDQTTLILTEKLLQLCQIYFVCEQFQFEHCGYGTFKKKITFKDNNSRQFYEALFHDFLNVSLDEINMPDCDDNSGQDVNKFAWLKWIKPLFEAHLRQKSYRLFDLVEYLPKKYLAVYNRQTSNEPPKDFSDYFRECNTILDGQGSPNRFIDGILTPINNKQEIETLEEVLQNPLSNVQDQFEEALMLYSNREAPFYSKSIASSIGGLEAFLRTKTGKTTLGSALDEYSRFKKFSPTLKQGFEKLYAWTCGPGGIRHALMDEGQKPESHEAKLMLILCSAFVNYLTAIDSKAVQSTSPCALPF
jgi:hypothetical protein